MQRGRTARALSHAAAGGSRTSAMRSWSSAYRNRQAESGGGAGAGDEGARIAVREALITAIPAAVRDTSATEAGAHPDRTGGRNEWTPWPDHAASPSGSENETMIMDDRRRRVHGPRDRRQVAARWPSLLVYAATLWVALLGPVPRRARRLAPITLAAQAPNVSSCIPRCSRSGEGCRRARRSRPGQLELQRLDSSSTFASCGMKLLKAVAASISCASLEAGSMFSAHGGSAAHDHVRRTLLPHVKSGRMRPWASRGRASARLLPALPTVAAAVPGWDRGSVWLHAGRRRAGCRLSQAPSRSRARSAGPTSKGVCLATAMRMIAAVPQETTAAVAGGLGGGRARAGGRRRQ